MLDFLRRLGDNSVAVIGALRAVALAILTFFPTLFTSDQLDSVFYALSVVLPVISLMFTAATSQVANAKIAEAKAELPSGASFDSPA